MGSGIRPFAVAVTFALYEAVRAEGITRSKLGRRLGLQENAVRLLLDLDHRSYIDQLDRALAALGRRSRCACWCRRGSGPAARESSAPT
jgi:hypothetical protein